MPNHHFSFKQFTIQQDKCAMKVCTDACLFGAWAAGKIESPRPNGLWAGRRKSKIPVRMALRPGGENKNSLLPRILDIGAGTGLLSLMLAQKNDVTIDAVEMDEMAAEQAQENIDNSPWSDQISIHRSTIQQFNPLIKYDFIISNPPFYENELKGPDDKKNIAHHSSELTLEELLSNIKRLIKIDGEFAVLLPYFRANEFVELAFKFGFHLKELAQVKQTPVHKYFRSMLWFGQNKSDANISEIIIKQNNMYTNEFSELLADFYLYL